MQASTSSCLNALSCLNAALSPLIEQLNAFHARAAPVPLFRGWFIGVRQGLVEFKLILPHLFGVTQTGCVD